MAAISDDSIAFNARTVVALWLGAQAGPQAPAALRQRITTVGGNAAGAPFHLTDQADWDDPAWGDREGQYAPALLAVAGTAILLPARVALYALPGSPGWDGAHQRGPWRTTTSACGSTSRRPGKPGHEVSELIG